jgi:hypothetical protein
MLNNSPSQQTTSIARISSSPAPQNNPGLFKKTPQNTYNSPINNSPAP